MSQILITVAEPDFDIEVEYTTLKNNNPQAGAIVTFVGLVRDYALSKDDGNSDKVVAIELQHYPSMTENTIQQFAEDALERFKVDEIRIIHRIGRLAPNEQIVFAGVAGRHRKESFAVAEMLMDYLKSQAPFWKKEERINVKGDTEVVWIDPGEEDYSRLERW